MLGVDQLEDLTQMSDSKDMEWVALDLLHFLHLKSNGIEPTVPDILFDTKVHNEAALSMVVSLEEAVRECAMILREHGHSEYLNLISVFFAEIIKILEIHTTDTRPHVLRITQPNNNILILHMILHCRIMCKMLKKSCCWGLRI